MDIPGNQSKVKSQSLNVAPKDPKQEHVSGRRTRTRLLCEGEA